MIAPMVAVNNKQVAFIVLLAGPGQKGQEVWNFQMRRSFESANLAAEDKALADSLINSMNQAFGKSSHFDTVQSTMKMAYANWKNQCPIVWRRSSLSHRRRQACCLWPSNTKQVLLGYIIS